MRASSPAWIYASLFTCWYFSWGIPRGPWGDAALVAVVTAVAYWGAAREKSVPASFGWAGEYGIRACIAVCLLFILWLILDRLPEPGFIYGFALAVYIALVIRADSAAASWQGRLCTLLGLGASVAGMLRMRAGWGYGWSSVLVNERGFSPSGWIASEVISLTMAFAVIAGAYGEPLRANNRRWRVALFGFAIPILAVAAVCEFRRESAFALHHKAGRIFNDLVIGGSSRFRTAQALLLWMTTLGWIQFTARSGWRMYGDRVVYGVLACVAVIALSPAAIDPIAGAARWLLCLAAAVLVADSIAPPKAAAGTVSLGAFLAMLSGFAGAHALPLESDQIEARILPSMAITLRFRLAIRGRLD